MYDKNQEKKSDWHGLYQIGKAIEIEDRFLLDKNAEHLEKIGLIEIKDIGELETLLKITNNGIKYVQNEILG